MHRIDGDGATVDNTFTDGDAGAGIPATVVTADWANDVQENLCTFIDAYAGPLVKGDGNQLQTAVGNLVDSVVENLPLQAFASVKLNGVSAPTIQRDVNVASVSFESANTRIRVTFSTAMPGSSAVLGYCVNLSTSPLPADRAAYVATAGENYCEIEIRSVTGAVAQNLAHADYNNVKLYVTSYSD